MRVLSSLLTVFLVLGLIACDKKKEEEITAGVAADHDPEGPQFSTAATASNIAGTSVTISWAATDDKTAAADLKFKVLKSSSNNMTTVATAEANGTIVMNYAANTLTTSVTSLTSSTTYYIAVIGMDADGRANISTASVTTLCSGKIMFLATVSNGNLGGVSGADATCNANKPTGFSGSTFKAMIAQGNTRAACYTSGNDNCQINGTSTAVDWVFTANQDICTSTYAAKVGTVGSNRLLTVSTTNVLNSANTKVFTGFNVAWGSSATTCSSWSSTSGNTIVGSASGAGNDFFAISASGACGTAGAIYCVQQ